MPTNSNFRIKNGVEINTTTIHLSSNTQIGFNSSGTFVARQVIPETTTSVANSSTLALLLNVGSSSATDDMNTYTGDSFTVYGSPTYSTDQTKFDDYSWYSDSGYNYIGAYSSGGYNFSSMSSSNNWTIDMWVYPVSGGSGQGNQTFINGSGFGDGSSNIWFGVDNSVPLNGTLRVGNNSNSYSGPSFPGTEAWHHVGLMRKNGILYFLMNGATTAVEGNPTLNFGAGLEILHTSSNSFNPFKLGYVSRIRIAPSTALFNVGTYSVPVSGDYDPAGSISITTPSVTTNLLDYNNLTNKPSITTFDQTLNSNSNVSFNRVDTNKINIVTGGGLATQYIGYYGGSNTGNSDATHGTYFDLASNHLYINSDSIEFHAGNYGQHRVTIDSSGLKVLVNGVTFPDNTVQTTAASNNTTGTASFGGLTITRQDTTTGPSQEQLLVMGASFTDTSDNAFTVTAHGDVTAGNSGGPFSGQTVFDFPGYNTDYISVPELPDLGTDDFTIDLWFNASQLGNNDGQGYSALFSNWPGGGVYFLYNSDGKIYFFYSGIGTPAFATSSAPSLDNWHHLALTRKNGVFKWWLDGGLEATDDSHTSNNVNFSGTTYIGSEDGSNRAFTGKISNVRVVKGLAIWDSTFTPPGSSSAYDLHYTTSTTTTNVLSVTSSTAQLAVPLKLQVVSTGSLTTGTVGQVVAIETTGKLAYWDGANSRWSYVADDSAV